MIGNPSGNLVRSSVSISSEAGALMTVKFTADEDCDVDGDEDGDEG